MYFVMNVELRTLIKICLLLTLSAVNLRTCIAPALALGTACERYEFLCSMARMKFCRGSTALHIGMYMGVLSMTISSGV